MQRTPGKVGSRGPAGKVWIRKFDPAVAFDGVNYFVTWVYFYGEFGGYTENIYGSRVAPDKTVLDELIITGTQHGNRAWPSLAFGGSTYLVVWIDSHVVRGARVTREGSVLDSDGFVMSASGARFPVDAFDGTNYLAVWDNQVDAFGTRVTQAGGVLDPDGILISTDAPPPENDNFSNATVLSGPGVTSGRKQRRLNNRASRLRASIASTKHRLVPLHADSERDRHAQYLHHDDGHSHRRLYRLGLQRVALRPDRGRRLRNDRRRDPHGIRCDRR